MHLLVCEPNCTDSHQPRATHSPVDAARNVIFYFAPNLTANEIEQIPEEIDVHNHLSLVFRVVTIRIYPCALARLLVTHDDNQEDIEHAPHVEWYPPPLLP